MRYQAHLGAGERAANKAGKNSCFHTETESEKHVLGQTRARKGAGASGRQVNSFREGGQEGLMAKRTAEQGPEGAEGGLPIFWGVGGWHFSLSKQEVPSL